VSIRRLICSLIILLISRSLCVAEESSVTPIIQKPRLSIPLACKDHPIYDSLCISPDGSKALWRERIFKDWDEIHIELRLFDIKKSSIIDLPPGIKNPTDGELSPDGNKIWILSKSQRGHELFVVHLKTLKVQKVLEGKHLYVKWIGNNIAVAEIMNKGGVHPVKSLKVINAETSQVTEKKFFGIVIADSILSGKKLVMANISEPNKIFDFKQASLVIMDKNWTILNKLAPMRSVSSIPCISQSGQYVAFQSKTIGEKKKYSAIVMSAGGKELNKIERFLLPLAVLDSGGLLTLRAVFTPGSILEYYPKGKTEPTFLAKDIRAATVVQDTIYYIQVIEKDGDNKTHRLATIKLPVLPKPNPR